MGSKLVGEEVNSEPPDASDSGGRYARIGYLYQDLCALRHWIRAARNGDWDEIWCETHEDITLVRYGHIVRHRYMQVKYHEASGKHWSAADLCAHPATKPVAVSILAKLLSKDTHNRESDFRLVANEGVDDSLQTLTYRWGSNEPAPNPAADGVQALLKRLHSWSCRCGGPTEEHLKRFLIEQHANSIDDLFACVTTELAVLLKQLDLSLPWPDEIRLLVTVLYARFYRAAATTLGQGDTASRLVVKALRDETANLVATIQSNTDSAAEVGAASLVRSQLLDAGVAGADLMYGVDCQRAYTQMVRKHMGTGRGVLLGDLTEDVCDICLRQTLRSLNDGDHVGHRLLTAMLADIERHHNERRLSELGIQLKVSHGAFYFLLGRGRFDLNGYHK